MIQNQHLSWCIDSLWYVYIRTCETGWKDKRFWFFFQFVIYILYLCHRSFKVWVDWLNIFIILFHFATLDLMHDYFIFPLPHLIKWLQPQISFHLLTAILFWSCTCRSITNYLVVIINDKINKTEIMLSNSGVHGSFSWTEKYELNYKQYYTILLTVTFYCQS